VGQPPENHVGAVLKLRPTTPPGYFKRQQQ